MTREFRIRKDGSIRLPEEMMDALALYPGSKYWAKIEDGRLLIEKAVDGEDPFEKAARGPDLSAMDRIRKQQEDEKRRARERFEEMIKKPPEIKPEDNPDLWR
jgi:hypothetical protein